MSCDSRVLLGVFFLVFPHSAVEVATFSSCFSPGLTVQHVLAPGSACKPITCCVVQFASLAQPWWREKRPKLSLSEHLVDLGRKSQ